MQLDEGLGDGQPETGPAVFAVVAGIVLAEAFKDAGTKLYGNTGPGVTDDDSELVLM